MTISSKTKIPWFRTIFLIVWCILWTFGGLIALINIIDKPEFSLIIWLLFWLIAEYSVICEIHWNLFGIEIIKIENGEFFYYRNGIYRRKSIKTKLIEFKRLDIIDYFGNLHEIDDTNNNLRFIVNSRDYCTVNKFVRRDIDNLIVELKKEKIITGANTSYK